MTYQPINMDVMGTTAKRAAVPAASSDIVKDQAIPEEVIGGHFWIASIRLATPLPARLTGESGQPTLEGLRHGTSVTVAALAWVPRPPPRTLCKRRMISEVMLAYVAWLIL